MLALRENTGRESIERFYPKEAITRPLTAYATEGATRNGYRQVTIRLMCPLHGATFDIRDGSCTGAPASRPIRSFPVRIEDDWIEVDLAET